MVRTDTDVNHVNRLGWTALLDGVTALKHAKAKGYDQIGRLLTG